ncbi:LD-carboxypeptidase [Stakelama saccharophila]|uniref:LD-carboxypeptidase n=1 Tax=Stakelama saccharophila TaxID=3075605 RepID=A0ABZ0B9F4_9SPHN|nr:LD-carboxypeptidase [Stakelama sp. W311]WNO53261.1 LD-carboxypeptidase [Stakelama sp. W311]
MRIAVVAPGRPIDEQVAAATAALAAIAYPDVALHFDPQCFLEDGHFAGSDAVRAEAFLRYANDPAFDAIWFARGGYGSNRILAAVMPNLTEAARNKMYVGYSDMGFLLGALYARGIGTPVHAPMPVEIGRKDQGHCVARALSWMTARDPSVLEPSLGDRPAAAFNLAILNAMIGTPWLPDLADHVLMIEEVSEPLYRIDRMLFTVANATQLQGVAGIRLGEVVDVQPNEPPFAETPEQIVRRWCADMGVPYLGRARIGHSRDNRVVPFGLR